VQVIPATTRPIVVRSEPPLKVDGPVPASAWAPAFGAPTPKTTPYPQINSVVRHETTTPVEVKAPAAKESPITPIATESKSEDATASADFVGPPAPPRNTESKTEQSTAAMPATSAKNADAEKIPEKTATPAASSKPETHDTPPAAPESSKNCSPLSSLKPVTPAAVATLAPPPEATVVKTRVPAATLAPPVKAEPVTAAAVTPIQQIKLGAPNTSTVAVSPIQQVKLESPNTSAVAVSPIQQVKLESPKSSTVPVAPIQQAKQESPNTPTVARSADRATPGDRKSPEPQTWMESLGRALWPAQETRPQQMAPAQESRPQQVAMATSAPKPVAVATSAPIQQVKMESAKTIATPVKPIAPVAVKSATANEATTTRTVPEWLRVLDNSADAKQRELAARQIGASDCRNHREAMSRLLVSAMTDSEPSVRVECVRSLAKLHRTFPEAKEMLKQLKDDPYMEVRSQAVQSLKEIGGPSGRP
jgi:hypothetical protein